MRRIKKSIEKEKKSMIYIYLWREILKQRKIKSKLMISDIEIGTPD